MSPEWSGKRYILTNSRKFSFKQHIMNTLFQSGLKAFSTRRNIHHSPQILQPIKQTENERMTRQKTDSLEEIRNGC